MHARKAYICRAILNLHPLPCLGLKAPLQQKPPAPPAACAVQAMATPRGTICQHIPIARPACRYV